MRYSRSILQFLPLLLLWNLTALPRAQSSVLLPTNIQTIQLPPPLPFQAPLDSPPKAQDDRRPWARFRDRLIRFIWNIPIEHQSRTANFQPSWETFNPPSSLKARYGGDVVLRFQIQSREESIALSEAIYVLMLDVWEFTADWVDIRLSKDMVRLVLKIIHELGPCPNGAILFLGPLATGTLAGVATARTHPIDLRPHSSHIRILSFCHLRGTHTPGPRRLSHLQS